MPSEFRVNDVDRIFIEDATETRSGFMSAADKTNLDTLVAKGGGPAVINTRIPLINNTPVSLLVVDMAKVPDNSFAMNVQFAVEATDGSDVQIRSGNVNANVAVKSGAYTTSQAQSATNAVTGGTLTTTFSWLTSGTTATLQLNASSSLTPTDIHVNVYVSYATHVAVTVA